MNKGQSTKRIVFTKNLVQGILAMKIRCTYRRSPKLGTFLVFDSRFKPVDEACCKIHCYRSEEVDPKALTDKEARLAGVNSSEKLRELFVGWYGSIPSVMYRNWFRLLDTRSEDGK